MTNTANTSHWAMQLASRFMYPPQEYVFVGEKKGDFCACGHIIENAFIVQHPSGHSLELGCDCIENYAYLGDIKAQVDAHLAKKKEEEKAHKLAEQNAEFAAVLEQYYVLRESVQKAQACGRVLYALFCFMRCSGRGWEKVKTPKCKKRKVLALHAELLKLIEENNAGGDFLIIDTSCRTEAAG